MAAVTVSTGCLQNTIDVLCFVIECQAIAVDVRVAPYAG
jgi:hypothetical protein